MDEADYAEETERKRLEAALQVRRQTIPPTGFCWNCEEPVGPLQLFCDWDCGQDYEKRAKRG